MTSQTEDPRHITILLCTFNGAEHLPNQLQSYLEQTHRNWSLWVSDDGSTDTTLDIITAFRRDHSDMHDIRILKGPCQGKAGTNFLSLLTHPDLSSGWVALSDQDDIWFPEKLARALSRTSDLPARPVLYSAQSHYIDDAGQRCGGSAPPPGPPVFATAMLQNIMAGHSMVLNPAALDLARAAGVPEGVEFHDWWLTLLVTAADGLVVLDERAVTFYRQHGGNVLGAPGGIRAGLRRAQKVLGHDYRAWVFANTRALQTVSDKLTVVNRGIVADFLQAPARRGPGRMALLWRLGLRRQGFAGTIWTYTAAFLGRL